MSASERKRAGVLARVVAETLTLGGAATLMAVSYRQAKRWYGRYRAKGAAGLRHGSAGRASNRATAPRVRKRALALIQAKYGGAIDARFGPTLAAEHLASADGLTVDHETLRRWMLTAGLWSRARTRSPHRRRRERKAHVGELVQMDGSFHRWFEGRAPESCLLTLVDDATGQTQGRFGAQETIWAAVAVLRAWIDRFGIPQALYTAYWADHNERFAQAPVSSDDFHVARPRGLRLDTVFRLEEQRTVSNDWVVRYANRHLQLERLSGLAPARSTVMVCESVEGRLEIRYRDRVMRGTEIVAGVSAPRPAVALPIALPSPPPVPRPPRVAADHPWRHRFKELGADGANWPLVDR